MVKQHTRRESESQTYQYTTITLPIHFHRPPSINNGTSTTTIFSPLSQALRTPHRIARVTAGCTILFRIFRCFSSLKMMLPSFLRSMGRVYQARSSEFMLEPGCVGFTEEGKSTPFPKALTICLCALVPGSTTCLAIRSASMIGMSCEAKSAATVDFPVAIPPVRPTTSGRKNKGALG